MPGYFVLGLRCEVRRKFDLLGHHPCQWAVGWQGYRVPDHCPSVVYLYFFDEPGEKVPGLGRAVRGLYQQVRPLIEFI